MIEDKIEYTENGFTFIRHPDSPEIKEENCNLDMQLWIPYCNEDKVPMWAKITKQGILTGEVKLAK